jgi:hypothetical protein
MITTSNISGDAAKETEMINTVRITYDQDNKSAKVAVYCDSTGKDYMASARAKAAELGGRVAKIEVEEWYNDNKIKSCKLVSAI